MRVLLDTNIFIYREDDRPLSEDLQKLLKTLHEIKADQLLHPLSLDDLEKDRNKTRKGIIISKIKAYPSLKAPPNPEGDSKYLETVGYGTTINEQIDNGILYAVYKNAVDFLITEDKGIHKKARRLGIDDRVLLINDALDVFEHYTLRKETIRPPALEEKYIYNLNLTDPIFDSLKQEYEKEKFEEWFKKISREGRKCWVHHREDESIGAILIYKVENEAIDNSNPPFPKKLRLKISTFKVTHVGHKIGELFIKLSIDFCIKNGIEEMYLTHFTKPEDRLVELITEYGFYKAGVNYRDEDIFMKELVPERKVMEGLTPLEITMEYYPHFYDGKNVKKFVVPIYPEYHSKLFTDYPNRQLKLYEFFSKFIVEGNTIKKVYISHSRIMSIKPGDILLFYRSRDRKEITSLGIVEIAYSGIEDSKEILKIVGKRTVFTRGEIESMKKPILIIMFRHHFHLKNPLHLHELKAKDILRGPPQSITEIKNGSYVKIKEEGGIDERFTVD
ncbi:hypothetical protein C5S30_04110 [ANME-1 cluster archaeon GoMg4]|nr:hypothetical protein [ANME-1 cluster archaeon GoMg4]